MKVWGSFFLAFFVCCGILFCLPARAQTPPDSQQPATQQPNQTQPSNQKQNANGKPKSQRQLEKELDSPYKKWLNEDVVYIITDPERKAFLQLQTNEDREQFIEAFWQRRNPDPDSTDNSAKEEHYRRIAYANEHFASGIPGWKTDRGRIYIEYGPADTVESHTAGEIWDRPSYLGGGETQTYAYEDWTYHYIEGMGENVEIEFVDPTGTGEFHYTNDPSEKDAFLNVPGAGLTTCEQLGQCQEKVAAHSNTDGSTMSPSMTGFRPESLDEFTRMDTEAKLFAPPVIKFKDLEADVSSRIVRDQLHFIPHWDFLRITDDTVLVPISIQIPNGQLSYEGKDGVHKATLDLFARVSTLSGRVVQTFEETLSNAVPDSLFQSTLKGVTVYQKSLPLRPGLYKLDMVVKDTSSNNIGVLNNRLAVPTFDDDKLDSSTLILADDIEPVPASEIGTGQFVIGSWKVRPKLDSTFASNQSLGVYLQLYNLKQDDKTHKNNASIDIQIYQGDQSVAHVVQTSAQMKQTAEQVTVQDAVPLNTLQPGKYRIQVTATDEVANQTITKSADFTVTPPSEKVLVESSNAEAPR